MFMGRATCPLLWAAALGAAQPCGVSLTTRDIAPASLRYDPLILVNEYAAITTSMYPRYECARLSGYTVCNGLAGL